MATLTSTLVANNRIRKIHAGVNSISVTYNSGATTVSASDVILLAPIPTGCSILDILAHHSSGAATTVLDYGVQGDLSAFATAIATGTITRAVKADSIPYDISVSDGAANRYTIVAAVKISGTATTSLIVKATVLYTADR